MPTTVASGLQGFSTRVLLLAGAAAFLLPAGPANAQAGLAPVVIRGASSASGSTPRQVSDVVYGRSIQSPQGVWTEIVYPDGTSIVLEPGAEFTPQAPDTDASGGRSLLRGTSSRGRMRVATSDSADVVITTAGQTIRLISASGIVEAGEQGSVTLVSGRRITVRRDGGDEEVIRRPGFTLAFNNGGPRRQTREGLTAAIAPFAPVTPTEGTAVAQADATDPDAGTQRVLRSVFVQDRNAGVDYSNLLAVLPPPPQTSSDTLPQTPPNTPSQTPPNTPSPGSQQPRPRDAVGFSSLAAAELTGTYATGGNLGTPLVNNLGSTYNASAPRTRDGLVDGFHPYAVYEGQNLGSARVRRIPAGVGEAVVNGGPGVAGRSDFGLATTPTAAGLENAQALSVYFRNITSHGLYRGVPNTQMAPYDFIANANTTLTQYIRPDDFFWIGEVPPPRSLHYQYRISFTNLAPHAENLEPSFRLIDRQTNLVATDEFGRPLILPNTEAGYQTYMSSFFTDYRLDLTGMRYYYPPIPDVFGEPLPPIEVSIDEYLVLQGRFPTSSSGPGPLVLYHPGSLVDIAQRPMDVLSSQSAGQVRALPGLVGNMVFSGILANNIFGQFSDGRPDPYANFTIFSSQPASVVFSNGQLRTYIVDVFMPSTSIENSYFAAGFNSSDRFFAIGGQPIRLSSNASDGRMPGLGDANLLPGMVLRFAVSDGLNPLGGFRTDCAAGSLACSVARQFLRVPAERPIAFNMFNAFRPEETFIPGVPRSDTHLLVVAGENNRHPAMRVDLQIAPNGRSSAGISVGGLLRLPEVVNPATGQSISGELALSGNTVGSVRPGSGGALVVFGNFGSLATSNDGYGGHVFENTDPTNRGGGLIGHFAIGESDPRPVSTGPVLDPNAPNSYLPPVQPGTVQSVISNAELPFSFTRLATNVGAVTPSAGRGPLGGTRADGTQAGLQGFAAGLVESPNADGTRVSLYAGVGASLGDVDIRSRQGDREITATITVSPRAIGEISVGGKAAPPPSDRVARTLTFGADTPNGVPTTAMASRSTFAAVIPGQAGMASVNETLRTAIRRPDGTQAPLPASNAHLAWGVFLGDMVAQANGRDREFVNMGFWVAGRPVDYGTLQTLTGSGTYAGGMVGNVVNAQGLRTVAGAFTHRFNFGDRTGTFNANYDGARYVVGTGMNGTNVFSGEGVGRAAAAGRTMSVQGAFFHDPAIAGPVSSTNHPIATGGVFGITGSNYGANGIFVGSRR